MTSNPDARPEPIIIDEFEGEKVRFFRGKLPMIPLELPEGYTRGTHVLFQIEARVTRVGYDEISAKKDDRHGEMVREHALAVEEVTLLGAKTASEADPGIGGSASSRVEEVDDFDFGADADCYYDRHELQVVHRGTCGLCERRKPWKDEDDFVEAFGVTREQFAEANRDALGTPGAETEPTPAPLVVDEDGFEHELKDEQPAHDLGF